MSLAELLRLARSSRREVALVSPAGSWTRFWIGAIVFCQFVVVLLRLEQTLCLRCQQAPHEGFLLFRCQHSRIQPTENRRQHGYYYDKCIELSYQTVAYNRACSM